MAQERVDFTVAANTVGMEEISKLINKVHELDKEMKRFKAATKDVGAGVEGFANKINKGTNRLDENSKSLRRQRQGLQQVGFQVNDFATSISTGANVTTAFNQQIGQLGYALSIMGDAQEDSNSKLAKFGNFLAGPWGVAVTIGAMLLGQYVDKLMATAKESLSTQDALEELLITKRKSFDEANKNVMVEEAYAKTLEGVTESVIANREAIDALNIARDTSAEKALKDAQATLENAQIVQKNTQAVLANSRALYQAQLARATGPTQAAEIAAMGLAGAAEKLTEQETKLAKATAELVLAQGNLNDAFAKLAAERAIQGVVGAINRKYDELIDNTVNSTIVTSENSQSFKDLQEAVAELERQRESELDALKEQTSGTIASSRANNSAEEALARYIERLEDAANPLNAIIRAETQLKAVYDTGRLSLEAFTHETARLNQERKKLEASADRIIDKSTLDLEPLKIDRGSGEEAKKVFIEMERLQEANKQLEQSFNAIGNTIANVFQGLITGAQSFKDAMTSIINAVINELMRLFVVQQIVGVISGAFAGSKPTGNPTAISKKLGFTGTSNFTGMGGLRAMGGAVSQNTPYIVGEKGPELFMPGRSGTIIPNHNMNRQGGGAINISVDARGSTDPEAVRQQVERGILEAAPSIVAAAQNQTISTLRRPRLAGTL